MGRSDSEIVLEALSNWGDIDGFRDRANRYLAPDVEYIEDPSWPGAGTYRGIAAIVDRWVEYAELLGDEVSTDVGEIHETKDGVFVLFHNSGRATGSGMAYDHTWGYVFRLHDGLIAYWRAYFDPDDARRELGLA